MSIACDEPMPMTQDMPVAATDSPTIFSGTTYVDQNGQERTYQWAEPGFLQGNRKLREWPSGDWISQDLFWALKPIQHGIMQQGYKACVLGMLHEQHIPKPKYLALYTSHKEQAVTMRAFFESVKGADMFFESIRWQFLVILAHYVQFMDVLLQCLQDPDHRLFQSEQTYKNEILVPIDDSYKAIWTSLTEPAPRIRMPSSGTVMFSLEGTARALKLNMEYPRQQFHTIHVNLHDFFNVAVYENGHVTCIREFAPDHVYFVYQLVAEDGARTHQRVYMTQKDDFDRCMDIFLDMDLDGPLLSKPVTFRLSDHSVCLFKYSRFPTACSPLVRTVLVLQHPRMYSGNHA
jgi:hypothetical protein